MHSSKNNDIFFQKIRLQSLEYPGNGRNELDHRKELTSLGIIAGEGPSAGER